MLAVPVNMQIHSSEESGAEMLYKLQAALFSAGPGSGRLREMWRRGTILTGIVQVAKGGCDYLEQGVIKGAGEQLTLLAVACRLFTAG